MAVGNLAGLAAPVDGDAQLGDTLRSDLTDALRREGFGTVVGERSGLLRWLGDSLANVLVVLVVALISTSGLVLPGAFGLQGWMWTALSLGAVAATIVVLLVSSSGGSWETIASLLLGAMVLYTLVNGALGLRSPDSDLALRYGIPLAIVLGVWLIWAIPRIGAGIAGLLAGVPLLIAIALGAPLASLFSQDAWIVAEQLDLSREIPIAGCIVLGLFLTAVHRLRASVAEVFRDTAERLAGDPGESKNRAVAEMQRVSKSWRERFAIVGQAEDGAAGYEDFETGVLRASFVPPASRRYAQQISAAMEVSFKRRVTVRFALVTITVCIVLFSSIFAIAWQTVGLETASAWSSRTEIDVHELPLVAVDIPAGPYLLVAGLLSVAATGIFLVVVVTKSEYSSTLTETLLHRPVERCLLLSIPYTHLVAAGPYAALPTNDNFDDAHRLEGARGTATGTNSVATHEPGERQHAGKTGGKSIWYRWVAPIGGTASFDTAGSDFDTLLAVYRGSSVEDLELVAENDDALGTHQSQVEFPVEPGAEYRVVVDGYGGKSGHVQLNWLVPPANDHFRDALELVGPSGSVAGDNGGATKEAGEPDHAGNPGGSSLWHRWIAPVTGTATFDTQGSSFATVIAVYRGSNLESLELVAESDNGLGWPQSRVRFAIEEGAEYRIAVDGTNGSFGALTLNWAAFTPPPNDLFAGAELLEGSHGTTRCTTGGATKEDGERDHAGSAGGRSVWFRWTSPVSGGAVFDTLGSDFDTLLAIYRGSTIEDLELVAENDDAPDTTQSSVDFHASEGVEYRIAVDGHYDASGELVLRWEVKPAPENDDFEAAAELSGPSGVCSGSNAGATKQAGEPEHAGNPGGASVWYSWVAPADGQAELATAGSSFDTLLAVYTGSGLEDLSIEAANDDVSTLDRTSAVTFAASAGTTYWVAVDGYGGSTGDLALSWTLV